MEISEIILFFCEFRDAQKVCDKIIKSDLDIFLKGSRLKIVLSLLLRGDVALFCDNDEIVLEMDVDRETLCATVDITDSKGNYYLKEAGKNICEEYVRCLVEIVNDSIDKISKT